MSEQNTKNKKLLHTSFLAIFATLSLTIVGTSFIDTTFAAKSTTITFDNPTTQSYKFDDVKEQQGFKFVQEPPKEIEPETKGGGFSISLEDGAANYDMKVEYFIGSSSSDKINFGFEGQQDPNGEYLLGCFFNAGRVSECNDDTIKFKFE